MHGKGDRDGTPPRAGNPLKRWLKAAARALALILVLPLLLLYRLQSGLFGPDRALESASQLLSLLPGITGQYLRRAFLQQVLAHCHSSVLVEFGTLFSQCGAVLEENVYVGPRCLLGLVHLERDVLLAGHVLIPSGGHTHAFEDPSRPIREQGGERRLVRVGAGSWIGAGAIVLADVGRGCVVGAGAVVTRPLPDFAVAAGVPARVLRFRTAPSPSADSNQSADPALSAVPPPDPPSCPAPLPDQE
ncbi:MAG: acyltransferase [Gemmataceae bacterium]|uniref:acyltransferase n=1 Tax=Thermogemmata fonticola TaxID=2755323 RepID=UPI0028F4211B|nr:acyltransferase [Thermogemmata fonticola]MCX8140254.1 acyltransferase [Gemmataceae bacterium]